MKTNLTIGELLRRHAHGIESWLSISSGEGHSEGKEADNCHAKPPVANSWGRFDTILGGLLKE